MSRLDVVIFGATGFTGKYAVKYIMKIAKEKGSNFTWGVAGRNEEKLSKVLTDLAQDNFDVSKIPVIIANVNDSDSLDRMTVQAKVIVNCCGPYRLYGEPVIQSCIANKCHHVDVSGETAFMERMQLDYHEKAKENEVYIVSACGFESIPADLGLSFLKNEFQGEVNSAEIFVDSSLSGKLTGSTVHYGTWASATYSIGFMSELRSIRRKLFPNPLPSLQPKLEQRFPLFKSEELGGKWCLPFPGPDRAVIARSQYYFYENNKERPIQVATYIGLPNFFAALFVALAAAVFWVFAKFDYGRQLLLAHPKIFSFGFASHEGPSEEQAENTQFSVILFGKGWKEKLAEPTDSHLEPPNKNLVVKVSGKNPGYGATCIMLLISALTILEDNDKMPDKGGVYSPGAAFSNTSMIKRLNEMGVKFEVVASNEK